MSLRNPKLWDFEQTLANTCSDVDGVILGVDGGATCTVCVCVAVPSHGHGTFHEPPPLLSRAQTSGSNRNSVGDDLARSAMEEALAEALMKAHRHRSSVRAICLAMSGVDSPADQQLMLHWLEEIFADGVTFLVHNDSVAALASGTLGRLNGGCVLIAGTGSIAFGVSEHGQEARAAGVGPLLGDHGSGYFIGQQALIALMNAHDGRGPPTNLVNGILNRLGLASPEEVVRWVYKDTSWARIASVVPVVKACAAAGDAEARKVLTLAVEGLATSVRAVVNRLNLAGKDGRKNFPLVMVGGVLEVDNEWDMYTEVVSRIMHDFPGVQPIRPEAEPALGAAMLAWTHHYNKIKDSL